MNEIITELLINIGVSSLLAGIAIVQKALTAKAVILAWICSIIITYCGGISSFAILAATFIFTVIAGKIGKKRRAIEKSVHAKTGKRDAMQVFCNVGLGSMMLLVGEILGDPRFLLVYAAIMASSLADSMASELGILSNMQPIDICTLKKTQRGISGGVSVLGLFASLLGAALIALVYAIGKPWDGAALITITLCGFAGALVDSIYGSLLQIKYRCSVCGIMTEKIRHCDLKTLRIKGFSQITNDIVNLMSNISVGILSTCILFLI